MAGLLEMISWASMYKDSSSTVRDFEETGGKTEEEEFLVCVNGFAILSEIKKVTSFFLLGVWSGRTWKAGFVIKAN